MGVTNEKQVQASAAKKSLFFAILISCAAAFGGYLYGYDSAVISGAIGPIEQYFNLNPGMVGFVVSSLLIGGATGILLSGFLSDALGIKKVLSISAILFAVSSIFQALATSVTILVIARMIGGIGIGMASVLSVTYISETAPPNIRGRLGSIYQLAVAIGIVSVYFLNAEILSLGGEAWQLEIGWRYILGVAGIPALVYLLILIPIPESPRWLMKSGKVHQAYEVLTKINGKQIADKEADNIQKSLTEHQGGSLADLFTPGVKKALGVGITLAVLQQLVGVNVIIYYAPQVFEAAGAEGNLNTLVTSMIGVAALTGVLVSMWLVDRIGRKSLLMIGTIGMAITQLAVGVLLQFDISAGLTPSILIVLYLFLFNISMGPVVWVILGEIFPNHVRGRAMSIATFCMWVANWFISQAFPIIIARFGDGITFLLFGVMCVVSFFYVWKVIPETKDKSLEEIEQIWTKVEA
ncbi:sugar porter family MFS transporter [Pontibacillus litoralis]|uniref:Sugar:proton symporter n=1 Tax=Pontibacillus litoralis JSM 072002 TaxID=1385512 RepID=A0A0A5HMC6_9BACI|nr:sugar porter family MFS transporter [Pontibacillus litoralis]KGX84782.1 sugar:proton symporter [Pontibacillus litoralis JSM 072002]